MCDPKPLPVSLARAVYSRASVILLDDVISAVDAQTSKHIIQNCFQSDIMKGRTIIIASHAVESLAPLAHHSIFLDDGRAVWTGSGKELLDSEYMKHLRTGSVAVHELDPADQENKAEAPTIAILENDDHLHEGEIDKEIKDFDVKEAVPRTPKQLIAEEERSKGDVDLNHWRDLMTLNGNNMFWAAVAVILILCNLLPVASRRVLE
jgi:ABC-type multidrug transport system ATPase subunit